MQHSKGMLEAGAVRGLCGQFLPTLAGVARGLWALCLALCLVVLPRAVRGQGGVDSAQSLLASGAYAQAQALLEPLAGRGDSCLAARLLLAQVLVARQREYERVLTLTDVQGGGAELLFVRAEAFRGLYRFEEAREFYLQYLAQPSADRQRAAIAHRRLAECQNAVQLMGAVYAPRLVRRLAIHRDSILTEVPSVSALYQWIFTPSALQSEYDRQRDRVELMAYPRSVSTGDRLFFVSARGPNEASDIHFVRKLEGDLWSRPEPVGFLLNSQQPEAMPLLSEDGTMLYFSSEGHYGMGGMDIFCSRWDAVSSRWMPPENLGFPYNSTHDDYLLAVPSNSGRMVLASSRGMEPDSLGVYYLDYDPGVPGVPLRGSDRMMRYAAFEYEEPAEAVATMVVFRSSEGSGRAGSGLQPQRTGGRSRSVESDPEYQAELSAGHRHQQRADTLREQLTKYREMLWEVRTQEERRQLESRIAPIEQGMLSAQRQADTHFANASIIEQEYIVGKRTLASTQQGRTPFADDLPSHLHGARLAHTAFQSGELAMLAKSFNHLATFEAEAKAIVTLRRSVGGDSARVQSIESLAAGFTRRYEATVRGVREVYAECLAVALMKSQRHEGALAQEAERVAQEKTRLASTLRRNQDSSARWRSAFDALLLDALGLWHYERAYAYTWGMEAYLERLEGRIALYDSLTSASLDGQEGVHGDEVVAQGVPSAGLVMGDSALVQTSAPEVEGRGLWVEQNSRYTHGTPIPRDAPLRKGVVYKLQLGAYSNPIDPEIFRGMVPVTAETLNGGRITKYYAGEFAFKSDADAGKRVAGECGFPDAFVVAWYDGRSVPIARAQSLEGERGGRSAQRLGGESSVSASAPAVYRVVVGIFGAALPSYVRETLAILAPGREVAKQPADGGQWRYSVPNIQERTQAERLRDNLLASGYTDAQVVAMEP